MPEVGEFVSEAAVSRPAPPLRPFVSRYIDYSLAGQPPGRHRGLPSGSLTLVVNLGPSITISAGTEGREMAAAAIVGGLHDRPVDIRHQGTQRGVQLAVTPLGARALFGLPAGALASCLVDLADLVGPRAGELVDRLAAAPTADARRQVLDTVLGTVAARRGRPEVAPEVAGAWDLLVASAGVLPVADLARRTGWGRRHLSERFRSELGLTPKSAARVLRFERACQLLKQGRVAGLADLAASCGYYDQPHLTNEWRELAGCTPGTWIAEELPFLQDTDAPVGAP